MPNWLRKTFVVLVTVLTFGLITPPQLLPLDEANAEKPSKRDVFEAKTQACSTTTFQIEAEPLSDKEQHIKQLLLEAENKSYIKFGERIKPVIKDEFKEIILPNIEKAIEHVAATYESDDLRDLIITEEPTGGNTEKIFHISDRKLEQDIIRFHVRKDRPPQEGFWFNFHYHTYHDDFQGHHDLGIIFWDKNTPPKWMS